MLGAILTLSLCVSLQETSPRTGEAQLKTFSLPDGYEIELVAGDPDVLKIVDLAFDDSGRMWAVTASEYPIDGNENPAAAELYRKGGRDQILVFDTPTKPGRQKPRVFADKLAMPMAVLPVAEGVLVGHGPEIILFKDTDRDGAADAREVVLTGFGIQDSHLMPHRFVRGSGGWIYVAQGAFNASNVRTKTGKTVPFNQCKVGRFRPDGSDFQVVGWGLNNIWGFVIDRQGEMFIQEANDMGYSVVPFLVGGSYPGIGMHKARPYSPWQPPPASFRMGGTGLSGLALSEDPKGYSAPYDGVMFLANPITCRIQAVRIHREGGGYRLEKLPDFVTSTDPWFRPIAIHFGPDGCLYVVDWYNKIISHNEVPRTHPERDKTRSRIWRIRHRSMERREIPDVARAADADLIAHLRSASTWQARAAWHQIVDRRAEALAPAVAEIASNAAAPVASRIVALWSLEGLGKTAGLEKLLGDPDRAVRREAVRALGARPDSFRALVDDPDPQVRTEIIRSLDSGEISKEALEVLVRMGKGPLEGSRVKPDQGGQPTLTGAAGDREFERSLVRASLERHPAAVRAFLDSEGAAGVPAENRLLACLALGQKEGALRLARASGDLARPLLAEEIELLAEHASEAEIGAAFSRALRHPAVLEILPALQGRIRSTDLLVAPLRERLEKEPTDPVRDLFIRIAGLFRLSALEPELVELAEKQTGPRRTAAVRALGEVGSTRLELFHRLALSSRPGDDLQREAAAALAGSRSPGAAARIAELWTLLAPSVRKVAIERLSSSPPGASELVAAFEGGILPRETIDAALLEKLKAVLGDTPELKRLRSELAGRMRPVLRLGGARADYVQTGLALEGPFTVESWIRLDAGITRGDALLGNPGDAEFNFHEGRLRAWLGPQEGDVVVASKAVEPDQWSHVAVTRSAEGRMNIYLNGALAATSKGISPRPLKGLDIGRSGAGGTAGWLAEFRVWDAERTAEEIGESFNRSFDGEAPPRLVRSFTGSWGKLSGKARIEPTLDVPPLITAAEAQALKTKFEAFRARAAKEGDLARGRELFTRTCLTCHKVRGQGADIGPNLDGAGLAGTEGLLRALLTPSAAIESGYRVFRVETRDSEILDGLLVTQDEKTIVLRQPNREDLRLDRNRIRRAAYSRLSLMPEGLLEGMKPEEVTDLFGFLRTLK